MPVHTRALDAVYSFKNCNVWDSAHLIILRSLIDIILNHHYTLSVGNDVQKLYRVKLQDSRQHAKLTYAQLIGFIRAGVIDLDDEIALLESQDWFFAWELENAFEEVVVNAYRAHATAIRRMRRSISNGWLTPIEFRDQRDELLGHEPGINESDWSSRPRPDLMNDAQGHELHRAAAIGAVRQATIHNATGRNTTGEDPPEKISTISVEVFRENISKIFHGDFPEWANPYALLKGAKANAFKIFCIALFTTIVTDPFRPWVPLSWVVLICGAYAIYCALRQLAVIGSARMWVDRFVTFILFTLIFTLLLIVTLKAEPRHGTGVLSRIPPIAALQDQLRTQINK